MTDYGEDLNFDGLDLAADGGTVTGETLLGQALLIRYSTPRGSVPDAPDDGIDLTDWLSKAMDAGEVASLESQLASEGLKDERFVNIVASVDASALLTEGLMLITLEVDAGEGPFTLVLSVSAAGVAIAGGA